MLRFQTISEQIANIYKKTSASNNNINESIKDHTEEIEDLSWLNRVRSLNIESGQAINPECSKTNENDTKKKLPQSTYSFGINIQKNSAQNEEDRIKRKISFRQSSALQRRLTSDSQNSSKHTENASTLSHLESSQIEEQNNGTSELLKNNRDISKTKFAGTTT